MLSHVAAMGLKSSNKEARAYTVRGPFPVLVGVFLLVQVVLLCPDFLQMEHAIVSCFTYQPVQNPRVLSFRLVGWLALSQSRSRCQTQEYGV